MGVQPEVREAAEAKAAADKAVAEKAAADKAAADKAAAERAAAEKAAADKAVAEKAAAEKAAIEAAAAEAAAAEKAAAEVAAASQPSAPGKRGRAVPQEEQQYTKLKYVPPSEGERQGVWLGMTAGGVVDEVYRKGFKAKYQQLCKDKPDKWVKLPPGDARETTDSVGGVADGCLLPAADRVTPRVAGSSVRGAPTVAHQQGRMDSCVFSSAASALASVGETTAALAVVEHIPESIKDGDPMSLLHDVLKSNKVKTVEVVRRFKRGRFDPLNEESPYPTTVQLLGEDGGVGHAVTIVGGWIFDATLPHALPLSRASLDECCSSTRGCVAYKGVERAVRYRQVASSGASSL